MKKIYRRKNKKKKYNYYKSYKDIKEIIEKRYNILICIITIVMAILFINLFYVQVVKKDYYREKFEKITKNTVEGNTAPRGRIYDRNHKLLVDNKPVRVIYYMKQNGVKTKDEIDLAYKVSKMIHINCDKLTNGMLRNFWVKSHKEEANERITKEEYKLLEERKITDEDIQKYKLERVKDDEINSYNDEDKEAAYIYYLMNKGYSYSEKTIKDEDVTDEEYALIATNSDELNGFNVKLDWDRVYLYNDTFKTILGSVSTSSVGIPSDLKEYYLEKGYNLNDRVGTSYLEYQYDDYLKGTKDLYEIKANGEKVLIKEGTRGNDLVLTIDIELQNKIEEILEKEIVKAKKEPNTKYYNKSFVVITNPKTGEILAAAGKQIVKKGNEYKIYDYTPGITTSPVVVGSVIKGASHIVGYNTGALKIGEQRYDSCVKLAGTNQKCSWMPLGSLNDLTALKYSSNTYQFYTALKVAGVKYYYNMGVKLDEKPFEIYRDTFKQFGLGVKTNIDLPVESVGYKGSKINAGLLLDFSIGQYDNYTPIQLSNYIGTIANDGSRMQLHLLKEVYDSKKESLTSILYKNKEKEINKVETESKYIKRVQEGFKQVLKPGGTGYGYIDLKYKPAGKTGTSQSFVDSDSDGKIDKETITNTFVGYAPYDDPKVTFTVISPDIYSYDSGGTSQSGVNRRIIKQVSEAYFNIYN